MMIQRSIVLSIFIVAVAPAFRAMAAIAYNESVSGDFSNSGLSPTSVALVAGSNQVFGATGRGSTGTDLDYFTISIPSGFVLDSLTELPGTTVGGAVSFIGLEAGAQLTLPTNPPDATGLLGWAHYGTATINTDLLPRMGTAGNGSTGFVPPLPAGNYSFWIQDFSSGTFSYGFDLHVSQVPEPGAAPSMLAGIAALVALSRSMWRASARSLRP